MALPKHQFSSGLGYPTKAVWVNKIPQLCSTVFKPVKAGSGTVKIVPESGLHGAAGHPRVMETIVPTLRAVAWTFYC